MATISSTQITAGTPSRNRPDGAVFAQEFQVSVPNTLAANDVVKLCKIPRGARIVGIDMHVPILDSNGSPALVTKLGTDETSPTNRSAVYGDDMTIGRTAAAKYSLGSNGTLDTKTFTYDIGSDTDSLTVEAVLQLVCKTAAATKVAGTIQGHVLMAMQK